MGSCGACHSFCSLFYTKEHLSITLFAIGFIVMLMFTCVQLSMLTILNEKLMLVLPIALLTATLVICIYLAVKVGQGGSRLKTTDDTPTNKVDDDRYWLGGFLYCNKNDPSLFVEKRFGMGYTLNFGNPKSLIAIGFKLYPGLNHMFIKSVYRTVKEFKKEYKIPSKVDFQVLGDITEWILS